jgi:hypothetical protein
VNCLFKFLVATLLVLCLASSVHVIAYCINGNAESYIGDMVYNLVILPNMHIEANDITSEGPDCKTLRWYMSDIVIRIDDVLHEFCRTTGSDELLKMWRSWLKSEFNVTMY